MQVQYWAIIVAALLAIIFSAIYYFLLNKQVMALRASKLNQSEDVRTTISVNKFLIEFVRTFVLALVIGNAVVLLNLLYLNQAALVAFWLWVGFPVVFLTGTVIHEHFPVRLAVIHAIDWLVKLMIITIVLTLWR